MNENDEEEELTNDYPCRNHHDDNTDTNEYFADTIENTDSNDQWGKTQQWRLNTKRIRKH
jgi:hypothetical protein